MQTTVEVGTKLVKTDAPAYTLEVLELVNSSRELPHARARVRTTDRDLGVRLYSVSALGDLRLFTPVADTKAA